VFSSSFLPASVRRKFPSRALLAAGVLTLSVLAGVPSGLGQHPSGGAPSNSNLNPQATSGVGKYANFDQMLAHQRGSLEFLGKVEMAGAPLPWDPIPVVVNCGGKTRYNTFTDAKGGFAIVAVKTDSEITPEKRNPNFLTPAQLMGCDVHASLEGFESTTVHIADRSIEDDHNIGTITLKLDERARGSVVSTTTSAASKDAMKAFEKAHSEEMDKHPDGARKDLEKAVKIDPDFAEAWYHLGRLEEADKPADALNAYQKAATADPRYFPPYERIAALAAQQKKWQDVVDATNQALKLDPVGTPQIWYFSAVGNLNLGQNDVAETAAQTSLAMDPNHIAPNTEQLLAVMLAGRGEYDAALQHLRNCLTYTPAGPNADLMKQQVAQLEKVVTPAAK
jgi:Tfp pilus assembly protein PilF